MKAMATGAEGAQPRRKDLIMIASGRDEIGSLNV